MQTTATPRQTNPSNPEVGTTRTGQSIQVSNISKSWNDTKAVDDISIDIPAGTFTVLLGPSGCGKSTTLRIIAGLEFANSGSVLIGGRDVTDTAPVKRDIAMVFQSYALFPHLNVAENILFGLKVRRVKRNEQRQRLNKTAEMLGLSDYLQRKPSQLSGGQQQRVALGRAIIAEKPVCLMDEPLSNLDAKLRNSMRTEIRDLQQKLGFSMVYVTHDQAEAITMADQVVVMREGRVEQAGSPREIYDRPSTSFVAGFIGTPPMNLVNCLDLPGAYLPGADLPGADLPGEKKQGSQQTQAAQDYTLGVRPENIHIADTGVSATVAHVEYMGADLLVECLLNTPQGRSATVNPPALLARVSGAHHIQSGQSVNLQWNQDAMHFFSNQSRQRVDSPPSGLLERVNALLRH